MSTVAFKVDIPAQQVDLRPPINSYTLHNAKDKEMDAMCGGNLYILPPCDRVGTKSDTDSDGEPIPGTYVISDVYMPGSGGYDVLHIDAKAVVRHILGLVVRGNGVSATSSYALSGISILPRHATPETIAAVAKAGSERNFLAQVAHARYTIQETDEMNAKRKAAGMEAIHGGPDWERAKFLIEKYGELAKKEAESKVMPFQEDGIDAEIEIMTIARVKAMELVEKAAEGKTIDKKQLFNELINDPEIRKWSQKEWSIRRRGHLPAKDVELDAAASAGLTVTGAGIEDDTLE